MKEASCISKNGCEKDIHKTRSAGAALALITSPQMNLYQQQSFMLQTSRHSHRLQSED
ncbi:hypothetical protein OS493_018881 [Desmophyllum pertusum]|uniref:Uncharacterized protein n=1 Tax=Desmophyllum pertusum TaxID=174260 RepID=A0A9W9ZDM4_9CNID|nr:hypothetical protein OS493_018881 [Desmophyllum pertusum]